MSENVKNVIALSTDKASNPINYMEQQNLQYKIFMGSNIMSAQWLQISVVRYGNVFG